MTFPRLTLSRILLVALLLWFVVGLIALALFSANGTTPDKGQGDRIESR